MIDLNLNPTKKELRIFSLAMLVFLAIVGWIVWHKSGSADAGVIVAAVGLVFAILGFAVPPAVRPVFIALMVINYPIGWVVTHVVMALIFYLVVTPLGVIMKLAGRDPMERRFDHNAKTYWKPRPDQTDASRYFRQF
jgi:Saxitoxin biosynthesis operon protein SxtJ